MLFPSPGARFVRKQHQDDEEGGDDDDDDEDEVTVHVVEDDDDAGMRFWGDESSCITTAHSCASALFIHTLSHIRYRAYVCT